MSLSRRRDGGGRSQSYLAILKRPIHTAALLDSDDGGARMFQPQQLLPGQLGIRTDQSGEKRLMVAILEDAILQLGKHQRARDHRGRQLYDEALSWVMRPNRSWLYDFERICQELGFDADYMRAGIVRRFSRDDA
jgi:hypothetical protein